ncbi:hypothetical protein E2562_037669 [Oryza meyeriana var. granulata]|uniref:Uncharacterized protein n=1 Tax=Oryza meyeriana var. granulata TaxID=110450 RepID=A0A6G1ETX7_9ORYZ|nr:hypothetical protein E2562_037669 [Oryza meyeriana var. granulata]
MSPSSLATTAVFVRGGHVASQCVPVTHVLCGDLGLSILFTASHGVGPTGEGEFLLIKLKMNT